MPQWVPLNPFRSQKELLSPPFLIVVALKALFHPTLVEGVALTLHPSSGTVSMATSVSSTVSITGTCVATLSYQGRKYAGYKLSVLPGLCADLILNLDFQSQHSSVTFPYVGSQPPLAVCGFSKLNIDPPEPFANLTADCHPVKLFRSLEGTAKRILFLLTRE